MNKFFKMSILKSVSLIMVICFIPIVFVSVIYAQEFEVNEDDYFSAEEQQEEEQEDNGKPNTNSEDIDNKEPCIDGPLESSSAVLSAVNGDSYASNFHFVKKFDKNGNLVDSWGTVGPKNGQFLHAHGIIIDSQDNVYVSDQVLPRVQKFDSNGTFIDMWGKKGEKKGQFVHQHDITVDSKDTVYVTDGRQNSRISVFDSDGKFIKHWGSEGKDEGQFIENHGIVVDGEGNVYVVDTRNVRIQKFDNEGNFLTMWDLLDVKMINF
jgi:hypothetical protein